MGFFFEDDLDINVKDIGMMCKLIGFIMGLMILLGVIVWDVGVVMFSEMWMVNVS